MQISFLELLSSLVLFCDALEDDVGSLRFIEGDHLDSCSILQFDQFGEEGLADLAFELAEVVGDCNAVQLSFYFAIYPIFEAAGMDQLTGSLAIARTYQWVTLCRLITETDLAGACQSLCSYFMDIFIQFQMRGLFECGCSFAISNLDD